MNEKYLESIYLNLNLDSSKQVPERVCGVIPESIKLLQKDYDQN